MNIWDCGHSRVFEVSVAVPTCTKSFSHGLHLRVPNTACTYRFCEIPLCRPGGCTYYKYCENPLCRPGGCTYGFCEIPLSWLHVCNPVIILVLTHVFSWLSSAATAPQLITKLEHARCWWLSDKWTVPVKETTKKQWCGDAGTLKFTWSRSTQLQISWISNKTLQNLYHW